MKKILVLFLFFVAILITILWFQKTNIRSTESNDPLSWWNVQSIDTVKYSRDLAREKSNDQSFDETIDRQTRLIAETGSTHVAIGTPYDPEFLPYLTKWVSAARKYGLKVWFRGNFSGWEEWFGYKKISKAEHISNTKSFIENNGNLFENGDIFSPCTECENGGEGDPRKTKDVAGFRNFLVDLRDASQKSFEKIGKKISSNYFPMNGDVARLVMDKDTTEKLGGIVVIDHYVSTPIKLANDIKNIALVSGGKVVLGEFGAPVLDINGKLTEAEQSAWINEALTRISVLPELIGVNYWTGFGGSTAIWNDDFSDRSAVKAITSYYIPDIINGTVTDERGFAVSNAVD